MTATVATAQTEWKDRYVTLAAEAQQNPTIAQAAGTDYTIVVWEDYRNGDANIYAQKIDNDNGIVVWFPIDGVPVCTAAGEQRNPRAAFDGEGNIIITWEDFRDDASNSEIWATRIMANNGVEDSNWPSGGRCIAGDGTYRAYRPRIAGTNDGAFITWTDMRNADKDVYLQYIMSLDGNTADPNTWVANGVRVNPASTDDQLNSEIVIDSIRVTSCGRCGAIVAYESEMASAYQIQMVRIDSTGAAFWSPAALTIEATRFDQHNVKIANTGLQNINGSTRRHVVAVWEDERNYQTTSIDIYAGIVNIEAGVSQWPGGRSIVTEADRQLNPEIVVHEGLAAIAWEDMRNMNMDIYADELGFSTAGLMVGSGGAAVCTESGSQQHICMYDGGYAAWIGWEDHRGTGADIYYQKYDWSSFSRQMQVDGWPVTHAKENQTEPVIGAGVFVYTDTRRMPITNDSQDDANIYAQIPGDECDGATWMHWRDELAKWTPGVNASDQRFAVDEDGNTYVVWREERRIDAYSVDAEGIYAQKLDKDGVPRWTNDGILLSEDEDSGLPDVCAAGSGAAVFVWREGTAIKVAKVEADASIPWKSDCSISTNSDQPRVTISAQYIYVVYQDIGTQIYADLFYSDGTPLQGGTVAGPGYSYPKICSTGDGSCYVVTGKPNGDITGAYVLGNFIKTTTFGAGRICTSYDIVIDPLVWDASISREAIVAFTTTESKVYCQLLRFDGVDQVDRIPDGLASAIVADEAGTYSSVCIDADNVSSSGSYLGGGAILAWDFDKWVGGLNSYSHIAQTNSVYWTSTTNPIGKGWSSALDLVGTTYVQSVNTKPDIVWKYNPDEDHERGVVAWQDDRMPWCGSGSAIIAQYVDYLEPIQALAKLWASDGEQVSPQIGDGDQYNVQIERSLLPYETGSVVGYWLDERAGATIVPGTRFDDDSQNGFVILKEARKDVGEASPQTLQLEQNYPNPVSLSMHTAAHVTFDLPQDEFCLLQLFDALGRRVSTLVDGWNTAGRHYINIPRTVFSRLPAGIYRYELRAGSVSASRFLILVK